MDADSSQLCPSCGAPRAERFCPRCGQKRVEARDLALRSFLGELAESWLFVEGRLWKSLGALARPGFLAVEWARGARVRYLRPLQLFFLANLLYFVLQPFTGSNTFNTTLDLQVRGQVYSRWIARLIADRRVELGSGFGDYARRFDELSDQLSRVLLALTLPLLAACFALLQRRARRRAGEHLVLATHFLTLFLLVACLAFPFVFEGLAYLAAFAGIELRLNELRSTLVVCSLAFLWLAVAFRRYYGNSWPAALARGLAMIGALFVVVSLYRLVLFLTTLSLI